MDWTPYEVYTTFCSLNVIILKQNPTNLVELLKKESKRHASLTLSCSVSFRNLWKYGDVQELKGYFALTILWSIDYIYSEQWIVSFFDSEKKRKADTEQFFSIVSFKTLPYFCGMFKLVNCYLIHPLFQRHVTKENVGLLILNRVSELNHQHF